MKHTCVSTAHLLVFALPLTRRVFEPQTDKAIELLSAAAISPGFVPVSVASAEPNTDAGTKRRRRKNTWERNLWRKRNAAEKLIIESSARRILRKCNSYSARNLEDTSQLLCKDKSRFYFVQNGKYIAFFFARNFFPEPIIFRSIRARTMTSGRRDWTGWSDERSLKNLWRPRLSNLVLWRMMRAERSAFFTETSRFRSFHRKARECHSR